MACLFRVQRLQPPKAARNWSQSPINKASTLFADLPDGTWKIEVGMQCFSTIEQTVTIAPNAPAVKWELKLLSLDQIVAEANAIKTETTPVLTARNDAASSKSETPKPKDSNVPAAQASGGFRPTTLLRWPAHQWQRQ